MGTCGSTAMNTHGIFFPCSNNTGQGSQHDPQLPHVARSIITFTGILPDNWGIAKRYNSDISHTSKLFFYEGGRSTELRTLAPELVRTLIPSDERDLQVSEWILE
jgi:hypothetical protein